MTEWRDISSAPKDGAPVWLRNRLMDEPVKGYWGEVAPRHDGGAYLNWVSIATRSGDEFFPAGRLICPDEWKPIDSPKDTEASQP